MSRLLVLLPLLLLLPASPSLGQDFSPLEFGTDETFEVATWNIEWFPKQGAATANYVADIIEAMDVDLIAMQELDNQSVFDDMLDMLLPDHIGYYESSFFAGLAYIYNPSAITINDIYEIYTEQPYWNAFPRSPMVMDLTFQGENLFVINNHYKCCGNGQMDFGNTSDEEYRRYLANQYLQDYIDTNLPNEKVILLGDLNDNLADVPAHNVFQMLLDDTEDYLAADLAIAQGSIANWSYPSWPSHLDHIFVTNELFGALGNAGSAVATIKVDEHFPGGWSGYDLYVSDHRPVAMRLDFGTTVSAPVAASVGSRLTSFPNPFRPRTVLSYTLPAAGPVNLAIYNALGQRVDVLVDAARPGGSHQVEWDARGVPSGIYFSRLVANGSVTTHKMTLLK